MDPKEENEGKTDVSYKFPLKIAWIMIPIDIRAHYHSRHNSKPCVATLSFIPDTLQS